MPWRDLNYKPFEGLKNLYYCNMDSFVVERDRLPIARGGINIAKACFGHGFKLRRIFHKI
jgi:hypothetical protein